MTDDEGIKSPARILRELAMGLASNYSTPVNYWLEMKLTSLKEYAKIAYETAQKHKETTQEVGVGL